MLRICGIVLCVLLQMGLAHADDKRGVEVTLQQFRVSSAGQAVVLGAAEQVKPGEVIEYQVAYHNISGRIVSQVSATLPIPKETEYVLDSAQPRYAQASLDGVTYAPIPLRRIVKLPNGRSEEQLVPVAEYRGVRWMLGDLSVNQKVTVMARVRLVSLVTGEVKRKK